WLPGEELQITPEVEQHDPYDGYAPQDVDRHPAPVFGRAVVLVHKLTPTAFGEDEGDDNLFRRPLQVLAASPVNPTRIAEPCDSIASCPFAAARLHGLPLQSRRRIVSRGNPGLRARGVARYLRRR